MTSSQLSPAEVIGLSNGQLEKAANDYRLSRRLQVVTFLLGAISIFIANSYTYVPALLALAVQTCSWVVRHRAGRSHSAGEEGRVRGLLLDALGDVGERVDLANWFSRVIPSQGATAPDPAPADYFASKSAPGMRRLCDHLQENAFWGKSLYKASAAYYSRRLWAFTAISIAATLIAVPMASDGGGLTLARVLVAVLASSAAATQLSEVLSWKSAESKSEALDRRLDAISKCTDDELRSREMSTVLAVYGDYCVTTAGAPPVPAFVYTREKDKVNSLWQRRSGTT